VKLTFLGTGTSQGVPVIACNCNVCSSVNPKDKRLRSSVWIASDETSIVIDSGPDFRQQMLRENVDKLDALVFTHEHKDHVAGMDDVRAFNFKQKKDMEVYAHRRVQEALKREFAYVFADIKYPGVPRVNLNEISNNHPFSIGDIKLSPIEVMHYKLPVLGFRINDLVYITDANYISDNEFQKIEGCDILILNALRKEEHISHFTLEEAIEIGRKSGARQVYFTHISHLLGTHEEISKELPSNMHLSYDGLTIEF
jgi:phosphoribosyl 1,2-cyclic phosphate phosphodiesterase